MSKKMEPQAERTSRQQAQTIEALTKQNREQAVKLNILYAFVELLRRGYDALLHHGVNYQSLPEYKRDKPLDQLEGKPISEAQHEAVTWIGRVTTGISAAIRRKQLKVHHNPPPPEGLR